MIARNRGLRRAFSDERDEPNVSGYVTEYIALDGSPCLGPVFS